MYHEKAKKKSQHGFTLIELMLAMGFIGSLLVVIAVIILQIMGIYNKGLTLKEVNQVSRTVVRDMQQSISSVDALRLQYVDEDTKDLVSAISYSEMVDKGTDYYKNTAGGRLCTGSYSYVWNTGAALRSYNPRLAEYNPLAPPIHDGNSLQFLPGGAPNPTPVRFIKKSDPGKTLCRETTEANPASTLPDAPDDTRGYINVFGPGHNELVLYNFSIESQFDLGVAETTELTAVSTFYYINMKLGTQAGDETISGDPECQDPAGAQYNDGEYCAINKIDFVARTGGLAR